MMTAVFSRDARDQNGTGIEEQETISTRGRSGGNVSPPSDGVA